LAAVLLVWSAGMGSGLAQSDAIETPTSEIQDLRQRLQDLELRWNQQAAAEQARIEAASKRFTVRPFGRLHLEAATFDQDADNKLTVGDVNNGLNIRRARLGVEGEGFDSYFYRLDVDFVTFDASTKSRPTIFDAYLDTTQLPVIGNLRIGHFREPFSLERLDSSNDLPFLERSTAVNTLAPFRNVGVMAFDWNSSETMTWAVGVFDEDTNEFGEDNFDRTGIATTGRATFLPWSTEDNSQLIHVGASYSYRRLGTTERRFSQRPEIFLKEGGTSTPPFVDTGTGAKLIQIDSYHVAGLEACLVHGPLSVQGEYLFLAGEQQSGESLFLQGAYLEAMYWLTGEHRNYDRKHGIFTGVAPNAPFLSRDATTGRRSGRGAFEATARVSWIDLDHRSITGGELTELTLGLNWYYAIRSRVMFNYIHAFLDRDGLHSNANIFAVRFQYAF
jgi:phosphate-selective porin OprO/OprP